MVLDVSSGVETKGRKMERVGEEIMAWKWQEFNFADNRDVDDVQASAMEVQKLMILMEAIFQRSELCMLNFHMRRRCDAWFPHASQLQGVK